MLTQYWRYNPQIHLRFLLINDDILHFIGRSLTDNRMLGTKEPSKEFDDYVIHNAFLYHVAMLPTFDDSVFLLI